MSALDAYPVILTPKQLAEILGVTEASLGQDRYLRQGVPFVKHGGRVRYLKDDVLTYLKANRVDLGTSA